MWVYGGAILWDGEEESGDFRLTELVKETPVPRPTPNRCGAQDRKEYKLWGEGADYSMDLGGKCGS